MNSHSGWLAAWCLVSGPVSAALTEAELNAWPYGVCAHVTRGEKTTATCLSMKAAGIRWLRCDFDPWNFFNYEKKSYDFRMFDKCLQDAYAENCRMLPIIWGFTEQLPPDDLAYYREYVQTIIRHYGMKCPYVEIWNEPNGQIFWPGTDPVKYVELLKVAYRAVKGVNPAVKVGFAGVEGIPRQYILRAFEAGAAGHFDFFCCHPYCRTPEYGEGMDGNLEWLRATMKKFGCGDCPVWLTEFGWATPALGARNPDVLMAGLKIARPEKKAWTVVLAANGIEDVEPDQKLSRIWERELPSGSTVRTVNQPELVRILNADGVDAVMFPMDDSFPADAIDAVNGFIARGGVLIDLGGLPAYHGMRGSDVAPGMKDGSATKRFPFGWRAYWSDPIYAATGVKVKVTAAGMAAGLKSDAKGRSCSLFVTPDGLEDEDEWIPLYEDIASNGVHRTAAAVARYNGTRKGAVVLSTFRESTSALNEETQARYLARAFGLSFGVEGVAMAMPYLFRSDENDIYNGSCCIGMVHSNFSPKPAFCAIACFTAERPVGSVRVEGVWRDKTKGLYHPQWKKPNGDHCTMIWVTGEPVKMRLEFANPWVTVKNMYGLKQPIARTGERTIEITVSDSPVYVSGPKFMSFK